jgi:hypothetical protein
VYPGVPPEAVTTAEPELGMLHNTSCATDTSQEIASSGDPISIVH